MNKAYDLIVYYFEIINALLGVLLLVILYVCFEYKKAKKDSLAAIEKANRKRDNKIIRDLVYNNLVSPYFNFIDSEYLFKMHLRSSMLNIVEVCKRLTFKHDYIAVPNEQITLEFLSRKIKDNSDGTVQAEIHQFLLISNGYYSKEIFKQVEHTKLISSLVTSNYYKNLFDEVLDLNNEESIFKIASDKSIWRKPVIEGICILHNFNYKIIEQKDKNYKIVEFGTIEDYEVFLHCLQNLPLTERVINQYVKVMK